MKIYHLASPADAAAWQASGQYSVQSLDIEGFIHCCTAEQIGGVLSRYFAEQHEIVLFLINDGTLGKRLVWENTVGGEERFPHIYHKLDASDIKSQHRLSRIEMDQVIQGEYLLP